MLEQWNEERKQDRELIEVLRDQLYMLKVQMANEANCEPPAKEETSGSDDLARIIMHESRLQIQFSGNGFQDLTEMMITQNL